jgi:hypothetical protein
MTSMEWLAVLAALAYPLMMLGAGVMTWVVGKRVRSAPNRAATESGRDATVRKGAVDAG